MAIALTIFLYWRCTTQAECSDSPVLFLVQHSGQRLFVNFFCFSRNVTNECSWRYLWPFFKLISCKSPQKKKQVFTHSNYEECGRYRVPGQEVRAYSTDYQCAPIGIFMTHIHYLDFFAIHIQYTLRTEPLWMLRDRCIAFKSQKYGMQPLPAEQSHAYLRIYVTKQPHYLAPARWTDNTLEV